MNTKVFENFHLRIANLADNECIDTDYSFSDEPNSKVVAKEFSSEISKKCTHTELAVGSVNFGSATRRRKNHKHESELENRVPTDFSFPEVFKRSNL